jgi:F-type H+-transporting ATPase subunit b
MLLARILVVGLMAAVPLFAFGAAPAAAVQREGAAQPHQPNAPSETQVAHEGEQGKEAHEGGWTAAIAKAVNFAILAGVLIYFLNTPLTEYLGSRIAKVRQDLVAAAETREAATRQLAEIERRLAALPGELESLKARGAEEITAERERIRQAAQAERERLLAHARREIDLRLRVARRELVEHGAALAVSIAAERIKRSITADDQARLVDRYTSQVTKEVRA